MNWTFVAPVLLLVCSNVFMTFAWVSRVLRNDPGDRFERRTPGAPATGRKASQGMLS